MIRGLLGSLSSESVMLLGFVSAACVAGGVPKQWREVVLAGVPLLLAVAVRQVVTSPERVVDAVTDAATKTAERLTDTTVGAVGAVTELGEAVVGGVVSDVVRGTVGGLVPSLGLARADDTEVP